MAIPGRRPPGGPTPPGLPSAARASRGSYVRLAGTVVGDIRSGQARGPRVGRVVFWSAVLSALALLLLVVDDQARASLLVFAFLVVVGVAAVVYLRYRFRRATGFFARPYGEARRGDRVRQVHHFRITTVTGLDYHCEIVLDDGPAPLLHHAMAVDVTGRVRMNGCVRVFRLALPAAGVVVRGRWW